MTFEEAYKAYIREAIMSGLYSLHKGDSSQDIPNPAVDACVGFCLAHEVLGEEEEENEWNF